MSEPVLETVPNTEPIVSTEPVQTSEEPTQMTFDEYLSASGQAEFDRRVQKAINTAKKTWGESQAQILAARDADLAQLQDKLKNFEGTQAEFEALKAKYEKEAQEWAAAQASQAYEFAVKSLTSELEFTSKAAKNYFIEQVIKAQLKMQDGVILGFNDFVEKYKVEDPSAIVQEQPQQQDTRPNPTFVRSQTSTAQKDENPFTFSFSRVRHKKSNKGE